MATAALRADLRSQPPQPPDPHHHDPRQRRGAIADTIPGDVLEIGTPTGRLTGIGLQRAIV